MFEMCTNVLIEKINRFHNSTYFFQNFLKLNIYSGSRAPRNYLKCDVKQCKVNGVEYFFLSFDV